MHWAKKFLEVRVAFSTWVSVLGVVVDMVGAEALKEERRLLRAGGSLYERKFQQEQIESIRV